MVGLAASARSDGRLGLAALAAGLAIALAAQLSQPVGRPLYDGVVPAEPYRYLDPPQGLPGSPTSFTAEASVKRGTSPSITAATTENPPQAQIIALEGTFAVPSGATTLLVSIVPVQPPSVAPQGRISGNVYRISVADPAGNPVGMNPGKTPTLAMRSAGAAANGAVARFANGAWTVLQTEHAANLGLYSAEPDSLGDFAVVDLAAGGLDPATIVLLSAGGLLGLLLVAYALRVMARRREAARQAAARGRGRIPSKRRPPRPPGSTSRPR